ncbi:MAG: glycosyltransferase family A protein [Candidatus Xenobiia bacterium LiM19]
MNERQVSETIPKVTVFIVTYNRSHFLKESMDAVLASTFSDFELIIYDNGSTDDTEKVVKSYSDHRIRYRKIEKNVQKTADWSAVFFEMSRGEYALVACDDDRMKPTFLQRSVEVFDRDPEIKLVSCNLSIINERGEETKAALFQIDEDMVFTKYKFIEARMTRTDNFRFLMSAMIFRKDFMVKENLWYEEESGAVADIVLCLKVNTFEVKIYFIHESLFCYRMHGGQDNLVRFFEIGYLSYVYEIKLLESCGFDRLIPQFRRDRLTHLCETTINYYVFGSVDRRMFEDYLQKMREIGFNEKEFPVLLRLRLWAAKHAPFLYPAVRSLWIFIRRLLRGGKNSPSYVNLIKAAKIHRPK